MKETNENYLLSTIKTMAAKRTLKDSVFTNLFRDKKYLIQLYRALHPEDKEATEDMIKDITINNVLVDGIYNDLGFSLGDVLIVLLEAQSTFSYNIIIRMLIYLAQTYSDYFHRTGQNLYGSKKVRLPKPELYVIYTGDRKQKPEEISLSKDFFGNKENCVDVKVKIIYDGNKGDIINQYIMFTKIYDGQRKKYGITEKAIRETIRICKDRNLLKEYLENKEAEVIGMMNVLFDEEFILKAYVQSEREEAKKEARSEEIKNVIETCYDLGATISDTVTRIATKYNITREEAEKEVDRFWKN